MATYCQHLVSVRGAVVDVTFRYNSPHCWDIVEGEIPNISKDGPIDCVLFSNEEWGNQAEVDFCKEVMEVLRTKGEVDQKGSCSCTFEDVPEVNDPDDN